jgi:hypothetical protein
MVQKLSRVALERSEWLTQSALERIMSAPLSKKFAIPSDLNRAELWADLRSIPGLFTQSRQSSPFDSKRIRLIARAAKQARSLREFILKNGLKRELNFPFVKGSRGMEGLDELIRALEVAQRVRPPSQSSSIKVKRGPQMPAGTGLRFVRIERNQGSLFEWLAGKHLPEIFEKHFKWKPGASRGSTSINGPYVRFAEQVFKEAKIIKPDGSPYSRESIAKALSLARAGKTRHTLKQVRPGQN